MTQVLLVPAQNVYLADSALYEIMRSHRQAGRAEDQVRDGEGEHKGRCWVLLQLLRRPQGQQGPGVEDDTHDTDADGSSEPDNHGTFGQVWGIHNRGHQPVLGGGLFRPFHYCFYFLHRTLFSSASSINGYIFNCCLSICIESLLHELMAGTFSKKNCNTGTHWLMEIAQCPLLLSQSLNAYIWFHACMHACTCAIYVCM